MARNAYYEYIFSQVVEQAKTLSSFAGCNFWGWGGLASLSEKNEYWQPGDDYTGDPAQEQQGLNSVFASDTATIHLIQIYTQSLK